MRHGLFEVNYSYRIIIQCVTNNTFQRMLELKWETLNPLDSLPSNNYLLFHGLSLCTHQNTQVDVTVDLWTTWGVGVLTLCTVENLCIVHSRPSVFEVPLYPQFSIHRFDQLQIVQSFTIYCWKILHVSGVTQFKSVLFKSTVLTTTYTFPSDVVSIL